MTASSLQVSASHWHFCSPPGYADDATALEPGDLRYHRAGSAGGAGDQHGFTRLRLAHIQQAKVGGEAGESEDAEGEGG